MTTHWEGTDPLDAEAKLRSLNRRMRDLHDALASTATMIAARPDSFAFKLDERSLLERKNDLEDELAALLKHRSVSIIPAEEPLPKAR